ncbi:hypothetical protein BGZ83_003747 [Gryganskiella cystojenkinii]|nr:hypothetical protein BGZ83_003747 [Gryganskiella cystojenkinii]
MLTNDNAIATLIEKGSSMKGWNTVSIEAPLLTQSLVFQALLKHAATLENVHILSMKAGFPSRMIQQLLITSLKPKRFWSQVTELNRANEPTLLANDLLNSVPWVCRTLVSFRCLISGVPRLDIKRTTGGIRLRGSLHQDTTIEDAYAVQHRVYDQLASLTELQELGLGHIVYSRHREEEIAREHTQNNEIDFKGEDAWDEDSDSEAGGDEGYDGEERGLQHECLSLSLESGLDRLSAFKNLRVFDFRNMSVHNFWSYDEQAWVKSNWTSLDPLYSKGQDASGVERPDLFWREFEVYEDEHNSEDYADPDG